MLSDSLGRKISYLRLSVTDRCDLRCSYCMAEDMTFSPKAMVLSLEELARLAEIFINEGIRKVRITGGEPLVRRNVLWLFRRLGRRLKSGRLAELTLTTNGTLLARHAQELAECGVGRVNVSLDSLNPETYADITRGGSLRRVLEGIAVAKKVGIAVKINTVALRQNRHELAEMVEWAGRHRLGLTFIEVMPLGEVGPERLDSFVDLEEVKKMLAERYTLIPHAATAIENTAGPSRYCHVQENGLNLGFITPHSHNFCASCNRVRLSCLGRLYPCLGSDDFTDLKYPLRLGGAEAVRRELKRALEAKVKGHNFSIGDSAMEGGLARHMSVTGG